jgi:hypothetical protein
LTPSAELLLVRADVHRDGLIFTSFRYLEVIHASD